MTDVQQNLGFLHSLTTPQAFERTWGGCVQPPLSPRQLHTGISWRDGVLAIMATFQKMTLTHRVTLEPQMIHKKQVHVHHHQHCPTDFWFNHGAPSSHYQAVCALACRTSHPSQNVLSLLQCMHDALRDTQEPTTVHQ